MRPLSPKSIAVIGALLIPSIFSAAHAQTSVPCSVAPIPEELQLSADQSQVWEAADRDMLRDFGTISDAPRRQKQGGASINSPVSVDLHAQVAAMRSAEEDIHRFNEANRARWLAVFDLLSPKQKKLANIGLLRRMTFSECPVSSATAQ